ncbi:helix-turn-helix domain-containing protein [Flagellimonas myxillae]|uniref:helix-turn-helix domain-containing protein n=1 Tax=Flagellimonas myxillae TaxID=2942214 RepID=UPI00201F4245|nr:helix-turn-helix domain-containing protein [Muricauda myxillae]MCL6267676.1 helix-turn-helix domain-containing protein [Muricauda myxillae]
MALLFGVLLSYNAFLTYYGWSNSKDEFYLVLSYVLFVPLVLLTITFYIKPWQLSVLGRRPTRGFIVLGKNHKYEKTGLSRALSLELKDKLDYLMATQKPYLSHELCLDDIADLLDISRHHASQVINENFGLNFYDYINKHRIEDAKSKLGSNGKNPTQSISEIAYDCGFNNRVSFYKAFRKITHTTPTEYTRNPG